MDFLLLAEAEYFRRENECSLIFWRIGAFASYNIKEHYPPNVQKIRIFIIVVSVFHSSL